MAQKLHVGNVMVMVVLGIERVPCNLVLLQREEIHHELNISFVPVDIVGVRCVCSSFGTFSRL